MTVAGRCQVPGDGLAGDVAHIAGGAVSAHVLPHTLATGILGIADVTDGLARERHRAVLVEHHIVGGPSQAKQVDHGDRVVVLVDVDVYMALLAVILVGVLMHTVGREQAGIAHQQRRRVRRVAGLHQHLVRCAHRGGLHFLDIVAKAAIDHNRAVVLNGTRDVGQRTGTHQPSLVDKVVVHGAVHSSRHLSACSALVTLARVERLAGHLERHCTGIIVHLEGLRQLIHREAVGKRQRTGIGALDDVGTPPAHIERVMGTHRHIAAGIRAPIIQVEQADLVARHSGGGTRQQTHTGTYKR